MHLLTENDQSLTSWTLNSTPEIYTCDSAGNLDVKAGVDLNYNDATHQHVVTHISSTQKYWYDQNGSQITRVVNGQTFTLGYDAENRLVSVSGAATASFVYDGDGRRVKSTVNGTTTYFIGAHYELTGSQVTKYYFAGTQRAAMRKYTVPKAMAVEYFLGDHLGSTSITTDNTGAKVSEIRYKPWGEVRSWWTSALSTTPAYKLPDYTFTGQFSYMDDPSTSGATEGFGLMFYNARWYDPYLNHFTQPDSIVPDPSNSLDWDRYSYAHNNPVRYTDPSGHMVAEDYVYECGTQCRQQNDLRKHNDLVKRVKEGEISELEALAQLTEYAAFLAGDCVRCFINDLGATLTGHAGDDGRTAALRELEIQAGLPNVAYHPNYEQISGTNELMQSGYSIVFQDPAYETEGVGGNQAHHYWFYVQYGYESGFYPAVVSDIAHETVVANSPAGMSYNDYALGVEGAQLGAALSWGAVKPSEVGDYIRQTLSPGSYTAMYWAYPIVPIFP